MPNNASNVTTGKPKVGGAIFVAPFGTALPTSPSDTLNSAFKCLGYVSEDGVSNDNSPSSEQIKAWGGTVVLSTQTERPDSFGFKLIEARNIYVLKTVYGSNNVTESSGAITVKSTADELPDQSWVIDEILSDGSAKRIVIPRGRVSEIETITYADNDAVGYGITVTDTPDSNGAYHYEYISAPPVVVTHTVTFNTDGGSEVTAQTVVDGGVASQPANPTKSQKVFSGWFADAELTTVYVFGTPVTADITVYAQWADAT